MKHFCFIFTICFWTLFANAQAFVDPALSAEMLQLDGSEKIRISIVMREQSEPMTLQQEANRMSSRRERCDYVVASLKSQASQSQSEVMTLLKEMELNDLVNDIRSLWLSNAITCRATPAAINDLAQRGDLLTISLDKEYPCLIDTAPEHRVEATREITSSLLQVQADKVWDLGFTGEGVLVGLVDSGFNYNHDDLQGRLWDGGEEYPHHGYDVHDNDNDPMDQNGHGTHCAGVICGTGTAGTQTGAAPGATLMCAKCTDAIGFGSVSQFCAGLEFVLEHGADLISFSVGFPQLSAAEKTQFRQMCDNILAANVVTVVAAGNYYQYQDLYPIPDNICTPGSCPPPMLHDIQLDNPGGTSCVICIGAVDGNDVIGDFSSVGPVKWDDVPAYGDYPYAVGSTEQFGLIRPDVCAPGVQVKSLSLQNNTGYGLRDGTSFATPCVSGVIALMLQANPELTPAEIDDILETTAIRLTPFKDNLYGSGRIDALAAVEKALDFDAITENSKHDKALIYPNPANDFVNITAHGMSHITITNVYGQVIYDSEVNADTLTLNMTSLGSGIYTARITSEKGTSVKCFTVTK